VKSSEEKKAPGSEKLLGEESSVERRALRRMLPGKKSP
jgi:hypothetical protein